MLLLPYFNETASDFKNILLLLDSFILFLYITDLYTSALNQTRPKISRTSTDLSFIASFKYDRDIDGSRRQYLRKAIKKLLTGTFDGKSNRLQNSFGAQSCCELLSSAWPTEESSE